MAELKGTHLTKFDATPPDVVEARLHGGNPRHYRDAFEIGNTDSADVTIMFRVPIDEVPVSLKFAHDDLTSGTLEIGLYRREDDGTYTVEDADAFASALALGGGAVALTEILFEAGATRIDKGIQSMWEWAGLSARPDYADIYVVITHTVGTGADGTFLLQLDTVG